MKKYILILIILLSCILLIGCSSSEKPITDNILKEVLSITANSEYVNILNTEDNGSVYRVNIELLFEPQSINQIQLCTDSICKDCYAILKNNNIERSISVWAQSPESDNFVSVYGRTYYSKSSGKFEFKTAKELNL